MFYVRNMRPFMTANQLAKSLSVDRTTVTYWIKKGRVRGAHKLPGARNWRIPIDVYMEFIKPYSMNS